MLLMISMRASLEASFQPLISLRLLQHPIQQSVSGFILHTEMQGDTISSKSKEISTWIFKVSDSVSHELMWTTGFFQGEVGNGAHSRLLEKAL